MRKIGCESEGKRKDRQSLFFSDPFHGSTRTLIIVLSNRLTPPKHINGDQLLRLRVTGFRRIMRLRMGTGLMIQREEFSAVLNLDELKCQRSIETSTFNSAERSTFQSCSLRGPILLSITLFLATHHKTKPFFLGILYTECKYGGPLGRRPGRVMKVRLVRLGVLF